LGAAIGGLALAYFPQCLNDPYAALAPALQNHWLDAVGEAQPLWNLLAQEPEKVAGYYATVVIGLAFLLFRLGRRSWKREDILFCLLLSIALLVSIWQVRGSRFALPLASVPLSMWVAGWRARAAAFPGVATTLKLLGAWLASF